MIYGSLAILLYLVGFLVLLLRLRGNPTFINAGLIKLLSPGIAALVLHFLYLHQTVFTLKGFQLGLFNAGSTIAAVITLLAINVTVWRNTSFLSLIMFPISALSIVLDMAFTVNDYLPENSPTGLEIHVLVSIIAYSLLGLGALLAILLSIQNQQLHNHKTGGLLHQLPPLQTMEKLMFDILVAGFIGLSIALASGFLFLDDMFAQHLAHKTILSVIAWVIFLVLLLGRLFLGWRGKIAIRWTLSGFVLLMLAYFGSKMVLELIIKP